MSLLPPNPVVLGKMLFHLRNRLKDKSYLEEVLAACGPFYAFSLLAEFRDVLTGRVRQFEDVKEIVETETIEWECVDTALNMMTRLKARLKDAIREAGFLKVTLVCRLGEEKVWSDLYQDEVPLHIPGLNPEVYATKDPEGSAALP